MGIVIFLAIFVSSIMAAPPERNHDSDVDKFATVIPESKTSLKTDLIKRTFKKHLTTKMSVKDLCKKLEKNCTEESKNSRRQKTISLNNSENSYLDQNYRPRQQYQESNIYYIKLPPSPYIFVPGLGYISQPPSYNLPSSHSKFSKQNQVPIVKVPIDFVSNGKPTSIYSYTDLDGNDKKSSLVSLNKGPYVFNGRPVSFYLLDANAQSTIKKPLKFPNYFGF